MSIEAADRVRDRLDGTQRVLHVGALDLETGGRLPQVDVAYQSWGRLDAQASNAVLVLHALTGDAHAADGPQDTDGWWRGIIGPGLALGTDRWFVIAPAAVGGCGGSTGPADAAPDGAPWGSRFPYLTLRDLVAAEARLQDHLGIEAWALVIGGSMGGARALEWAATRPESVRRCAVVASCAATTAEQIAWAQAQVAAIRLDPHFHGGDYYDTGSAPEDGLGIARRIAHLSYRSEPELHQRFGRKHQSGEDPFGTADRDGRGRYAVESYLDHQAGKLSSRFDANAYLTLTEALMSHDVGRGRGGVEAALGALTDTEFLVVDVDSDRLYFPAQSAALAAALPHVSVGHIASPIGHDGFLTETGQLGRILAPFLA